jgi:hypothetical protein
MACFVVPLGEAIVTTIVQKVVENKEKKEAVAGIKKAGITWSKKLSWLNIMLWGGTVLLALEHVWHGEVVPWPPFLTAMENPADVAPMLHEIATIGVAMALFVTFIWVIMVLVADYKAKAKPELTEKLAGRGD